MMKRRFGAHRYCNLKSTVMKGERHAKTRLRRLVSASAHQLAGATVASKRDGFVPETISEDKKFTKSLPV